MEKILASEPWSFDRHLVVLQRLEIASLVCGLAFNIVSIWFQVHSIPLSYLNRGVTEEQCEVIGEMDRTSTNAELKEAVSLRFMFESMCLNLSVRVLFSRLKIARKVGSLLDTSVFLIYFTGVDACIMPIEIATCG